MIIPSCTKAPLSPLGYFIPCGYLCVPKAIFGVVDIDGTQKLLGSLLAINELALWDCTGIQYSVPVWREDGGTF